ASTLEPSPVGGARNWATGSETEKNIKSMPIPAANSMAVQLNRLQLGRGRSGPGRALPTLEPATEQTDPSTATATSASPAPTARPTRPTTAVITASAPSWSIMAQRVKARIVAAEPKNTTLLMRLGPASGGIALSVLFMGIAGSSEYLTALMI